MKATNGKGRRGRKERGRVETAGEKADIARMGKNESKQTEIARGEAEIHTSKHGVMEEAAEWAETQARLFHLFNR